MTEIAKLLGQFLDRSAIDKTGLSGHFTFDLHSANLTRVIRDPGAPPDPVDPNAASIFTAVQEQLGLKLDSQRGPIEVLVVDSAERPSPD
jgi:uncharacterized protein (TIGR03435 family)